ncbi:hypothetical protein [Streptomyces albogriseolus]|uniref:hypothetical protein n=1 Tax=Streptomyces albogriseolus TaxID=1887 RepID=UPI0036C20998
MSIRFVPSSARPAFDADARTILIPDTASYTDTMILVRAILAELHVVQPPFGAICWCGKPVDLGPHADADGALPLIPQQKMSEVVVRHGA